MTKDSTQNAEKKKRKREEACLKNSRNNNGSRSGRPNSRVNDGVTVDPTLLETRCQLVGCKIEQEAIPVIEITGMYVGYPTRFKT